MKTLLAFITVMISFTIQAQQTSSILDPLSFGVVLDHPAVKDVVKKADVAYLKDDKGTLHIDIYAPPKMQPGERRPAVIFLNAVGDRPGSRPLKSWGI